MDLASCKTLSRFNSRELLIAGPDRNAATRLLRHHLSTVTRKTSRLTIDLCYEILLGLSSLFQHQGCTATLKKKTLALGAVRWKRRVPKSICRRGSSVATGVDIPTTTTSGVLMLRISDSAEEEKVKVTRRELRQLVREVDRCALTLGIVVVIEWRHSDYVPPTTTTVRGDVGGVWNHISSVLVTNGATILRWEATSAALACRKGILVGPKSKRDVRALLEQFDDDFGVDDEEGEEDEYGDEIALYMLKLEKKNMPSCDLSDLSPSLIDIRQEGIDELQSLWGYFHTWLGYSVETYWVAHNLFDRYLSARKREGTLNTITYDGSYLLARATLFIAAKYMEVILLDVTTFSKAKNTDYCPVEALKKGEAEVLRMLEFEVCGGCSPWFWLSRRGRKSSTSTLKESIENFLVQLMMKDERFCGVKPSMVAAIVVYAVCEMGLGEMEKEKGRDRLLWNRWEEVEVERKFEMLVEAIEREEMSESNWIYRWYKREARMGASEFVLRWFKVYHL